MAAKRTVLRNPSQRRRNWKITPATIGIFLVSHGMSSSVATARPPLIASSSRSSSSSSISSSRSSSCCTGYCCTLLSTGPRCARIAAFHSTRPITVSTTTPWAPSRSLDPFTVTTTPSCRCRINPLFQAMSSEDIKAHRSKKNNRNKGSSNKGHNHHSASSSSLSSSDFDHDGNESSVTSTTSTTTTGSIHAALHAPFNNMQDDSSASQEEDSLESLSSKGMARLSRAVAKASAEREALRISNQNISRNNASASSLKNNSNGRISNGNTNMNMKETAGNEPKSLSQLTRVIDSQLYANGPRGTTRGDYPHIDGVVQNARDHMISLLGFNQVKGDWKMHTSTSTFNVAVVFGKELVRDQVTVEYASRIRTLARLFKEEPEFRPKLVCFCGGIAEGSHVANSDAGYIFFRHMCEAQGIDLDGVSMYIDNSSKNDAEAVAHVTEEVKKKYIPKWLNDSPEMTDLMQKMIDVHFTLVSTEYHLCNMNDVHHRSPDQSLLKEIENMGREFLDRPRMMSYDRDRSNNDLRGNSISGLVKTSWSFQYATYPYIFAKNDLVAFLGKCFLLAEELVPLLVNMKAVVDQKEFFQRDNYLILASIRRSLVEEIETLHKPSHSRKKILNNELRRLKDIYGNERDVISILEGALLSLGRCVDLVKPAGMHTGSVSKDDWKKALSALEHSMSEIRTFCDPDRPLMPSEWGKLVDDDSVASKRGY